MSTSQPLGFKLEVFQTKVSPGFDLISVDYPATSQAKKRGPKTHEAHLKQVKFEITKNSLMYNL